jgi:hypothetical protein
MIKAMTAENDILEFPLGTKTFIWLIGERNFSKELRWKTYNLQAGWMGLAVPYLLIGYHQYAS